MDADGSGSIDADELQDAFELLGLKLKRPEIKVRAQTLNLADTPVAASRALPDFITHRSYPVDQRTP